MVVCLIIPQFNRLVTFNPLNLEFPVELLQALAFGTGTLCDLMRLQPSLLSIHLYGSYRPYEVVVKIYFCYNLTRAAFTYYNV